MKINKSNCDRVGSVICHMWLLVYQFPARSCDTQPKSQVLPTVRLLGITYFPQTRWNIWPLCCSSYQGAKVFVLFSSSRWKFRRKTCRKPAFLAALFSIHSNFIRNWIGSSFFEGTYRKRILTPVIPLSIWKIKRIPFWRRCECCGKEIKEVRVFSK